MRARGVAEDERMWWNVVRYHRASADQCKLANRHTTANHRPAANRRAIAHQRRRHFPIVRRLQLTCRRDCAWEQIIGEADVWSNKDTVFERDPLKDRRMVLYLHPR